MSESSLYLPHTATIKAQVTRSKWTWVLLLGSILGLTLLLGLAMISGGPDFRIIGWFLFFGGIAAIIYRPRYGIYLTLFFALIGDGLIIPWYPFAKNFSSTESIFFVSNSLIFSPLETFLIVTAISWLARGILFRQVRLYFGELVLPTATLIFFVLIGFIYGISTGGDLTIALWEVRPFFYLLLMVVLSSNLFTQREHYSNLIMWAVAALTIEAIIGVLYVITVAGGHITSSDGISEHSAAIHMNTVFVLIITSWLFRGSLMKRFGLLPALPIMLITYMAEQRRAAFVSLAVAVLLIALILFFENRKLFWILIPPLSVVALLYIAAFWNSTSTLAMPAQAVKSVIAQNESSARNQLSNVYRVLENLDTGYTIHQNPIMGVGFGNKFYLPIALPDISFFLWWNYLPHNSIIYVWLKAGLGGFLAMLYFVGISIITGARLVRRILDPETKVIILTGVLYIVMHFLYAYVDISWDAQSMLYLGAVIGMINTAEMVLSKPDTPPKKQFPWQPDPAPRPGLLP